MIATITGTGSGTAPVVNLTFPFIDKTHVIAAVNGSPVAFTWSGASQVTFSAPVANGATWTVYRQTPTSPAIVDFTNGSLLTETDLDLAETSHRYRDEELADLNTSTNATLSQEIADRSAAVTAEANTRSAADNVLQANIDSEAASRASADANETAARIAGDASEAAARDTAISAAVGAEAASRSAADASIQTQMLAVINHGYTLPTEQIIVTPEAYGAVRYDPLNEVDASDGLQAFFDAFQSEDFARRHIGDWSGEWMVTRTIKVGYWSGLEPNVERRFRMGTLRVPELARLPGGVPLDPVLDIAGPSQRWDGYCGIHPTGTSQTNPAFRPYYSRSILHGVRIRCASNSTFGDFTGDCIRRTAVWHTSSPSNGFTLNGITFPSNVNEGTIIGRVRARFSGSSDRGSEATPLVASARVQGKRSSGAAFTSAEVFAANITGMAGSYDQRTQLTVPSTADLQIYDLVKARVELTEAIYGTIAADNATSSFIWSAGDPTNLDGAGNGLQVGDLYPMFTSGPNANKKFRITAFGGTSNRTITVKNDVDGSAPVTDAATSAASYRHNGQWSWHWVSNVIDGTNFTVEPWVPNRINSAFHIVHGGAYKSEGGDQANTTVTAIITNASALSANIVGLFCPHIGTILAQNSTVGVQVGRPTSGTSLGLVVDHAHIGTGDGCDVPILAASSTSQYRINAMSSFDLSACVVQSSRVGVNDQNPANASIGQIELNFGGTSLDYIAGRSDLGLPTFIDNSKLNRQQFAFGASPTLTVNFNRDEFKFFPGHHWAEIHWMASTGGAPVGTLTLNLNATLAALGWTFAGAGSGTTYTLTSPASAQVIRLYYINQNKKVAIVPK